MIVHRIAEIAERVRAEMVALLASYDDPEPRRLSNACSFAAYALMHSLRGLGVQAVYVHGTFGGNQHSWVESGPWVVDIAAAQFGCDDVEIGTRGDMYKPIGFVEQFADSDMPAELFSELDAIVDRVVGERRAA